MTKEMYFRLQNERRRYKKFERIKSLKNQHKRTGSKHQRNRILAEARQSEVNENDDI